VDYKLEHKCELLKSPKGWAAVYTLSYLKDGKLTDQRFFDPGSDRVFSSRDEAEERNRELARNWLSLNDSDGRIFDYGTLRMTEDEAQAWLKYRRIRFPVKLSTYPKEPGWWFRLIRPSHKSFRVLVPNKSAASLLHLISSEAWEKYPTRKEGDLANEIWRFFSREELRGLAQEDWSE